MRRILPFVLTFLCGGLFGYFAPKSSAAQKQPSINSTREAPETIEVIRRPGPQTTEFAAPMRVITMQVDTSEPISVADVVDPNHPVWVIRLNRSGRRTVYTAEQLTNQ